MRPTAETITKKIDTPKSQFLIMKISAAALITFMFAILSFHSYRYNLATTQHARNRVPALGPVAARPAAPDLRHLSSLYLDSRFEHTKGQILHINFWASWCGPCVEELKDFQNLSKEIGDEYHVLFINADTTTASIAEAKQLLARWAPSAPAVFDDTSSIHLKPARDLVQKMNVDVLPYHIVLDRQGRIAAAFFASINTYKSEFKKLLANLLEEP